MTNWGLFQTVPFCDSMIQGIIKVKLNFFLYIVTAIINLMLWTTTHPLSPSQVNMKYVLLLGLGKRYKIHSSSMLQMHTQGIEMSQSPTAVLQGRLQSLSKQRRTVFMPFQEKSQRSVLTFSRYCGDGAHVPLHQDFIAKATMAILGPRKI